MTVGRNGICTRYHGSMCDGTWSKVGRKAKLSGTAEFSVSGNASEAVFYRNTMPAI